MSLARAKEPSLETDEALVARLRKGERAAFKPFYRRHARVLAGIVYRVMGDDSELDDVVQDTFLETLKALRRVEDASRIRSFMITIAVRQARKRLNGRQRRRRLVDAVGAVRPTSSDPRDRGEVEALLAALRELPEKIRTPYVLVRVEGLTLAAAAEACEVSLATLKRRLKDADGRVKRRLEHG